MTTATVNRTTFAIGDRVEFRDTRTTRAWGVAGLQGAVRSLDPDGDREDVVQVQLDDGRIPFGDMGVNTKNLIRL